MEYYSIRERIAWLLIENTGRLFSVDDIIAILGLDLKPREVYEHLRHIAKTIRRQSNNKLELVMEPPKCMKCGYVFKDLDRPRKPSKCPRCRSTWISQPRFTVIER